MDVVLMDSDDVKKYAEEFMTHRATFLHYVYLFSNLIDQLEKLWDGEDAKKYIASMRNDDLVELKRIGDILNRYGTYLKSVPEIYQLCDEIYSGKAIDF